MRKTLRSPELALVLRRNDRSRPLAKGWRAFSNINDDVEDLAGDDTDQLSLRLFDLVMQAPQNVFRGAGMIVLHERRAQPGLLLEEAKVEAFEEEATVVTEHFWFDDQDLGEGGVDDLHGLA